MSGSPYELWVVGLRAWQRDPSTDLSGLPILLSESLPPEAYQRLFNHMRQAIDAMMAEFTELLARDIGHATSEHDYARAMVGLRARLARRVQLAEHPGLPEEVRVELRKGVATDVTALQMQVEELVTANANRYGSDRSHTEQMLRIVRQNRFTVILEPGFPLESLFTPTNGFGSPIPHQQRSAAPPPYGAIPDSGGGPHVGVPRPGQTYQTDRRPAAAPAGPGPVPTSSSGFVRRRVYFGDDTPSS